MKCMRARTARLRIASFGVLTQAHVAATGITPQQRLLAACKTSLRVTPILWAHPSNSDRLIDKREHMSAQHLIDGIHENLIRLSRPVGVSFEFFPPKDEAMEKTLWTSIERLAPLRPRFVSVTYGADGSTRARTHSIVTRIMRETDLLAAPHLTCVGAPREEIL